VFNARDHTPCLRCYHGNWVRRCEIVYVYPPRQYAVTLPVVCPKVDDDQLDGSRRLSRFDFVLEFAVFHLLKDGTRIAAPSMPSAVSLQCTTIMHQAGLTIRRNRGSRRRIWRRTIKGQRTDQIAEHPYYEIMRLAVRKEGAYIRDHGRTVAIDTESSFGERVA
jgi:hypothetical protein